MKIRKGLSLTQFAPVLLARIKAVDEIKRLLGGGLGGHHG